MSVSQLVGGPSILLNLILVDAGVRPAMLVQPVDFGEWKATDPKTKKYMKSIKKYFPDLIYSDDYSNFQGIIIAKQDNYNGQTDISNSKMGIILGYPCYAELDIILDNEMDVYEPELSQDIYNMEVVVNTTEIVQLFGNRCIGESAFSAFADIAKNARKAFKHSKYQHLLTDLHIKSVTAVSTLSISTSNIINKLVAQEKLPTEYIDETINYMWNLDDLQMVSEEIMNTLYNPENKIHNGMLMSILLECNMKYSRERPIFGTKSKELSHYCDIRKSWFDGIIQLFKITSGTPQPRNIISDLLSYIRPNNKALTRISDPINEIMYKIIHKIIISTEEHEVIHSRLIATGGYPPELAGNIINQFIYTNDTHIGILLVVLLELIPKYDPTIPLQKMPQDRYEHFKYLQLCYSWIEQIGILFTRTA